MKSLENLKAFQIKNEFEKICGGVSGSFSCGGSVYAYDGDFSVTGTSSVSVSILIVSGTFNNNSTDFCGMVSADGGEWRGCAQRGVSGWTTI